MCDEIYGDYFYSPKSCPHFNFKAEDTQCIIFHLIKDQSKTVNRSGQLVTILSQLNG